MKIVMLLSFIPNPRMNRRINFLKRKYEITLIYWNRTNKKAKDTLPYQDIKIHEINLEADFHVNNPIKRIMRTMKFSKISLRLIKEENPDIVYVQNIDMLQIAYRYQKFRNVKIVYEIADINSLVIDKQKQIIKKILGWILRYQEKKYLKKVSILVITSLKYYEGYYYKLINKDQVIFIPNTPNLEHFKGYKKKETGPFTIAYIGAIRYEEQLKMLIDAAKVADVKVFIAGFSFNNIIEDYIKDKDYVIYYGPYQYEKEVAYLYSQADAIYSVYNVDKNNVKLALPNRLYEAIYCKLPLIVSKNTYLGEVVEKLGIGISINYQDKFELINALLRLKNDNEFRLHIEDNCSHNYHLLDLDSYHDKLLIALEKIC